MKYILYMAITANGYIAKSNGEVNWSEAEIASYTEMVALKKNIIIGSATYELTKAAGDFGEVGDNHIFVISKTPEKYKSDSNKQFMFFKTAAKVEAKAAELGISELLIAGGGKINSLFWEADKIDEVYLDVEPHIFGSGIPLFSDISKGNHLQLLGTRQVGENGIQLHYVVVK